MERQHMEEITDAEVLGLLWATADAEQPHQHRVADVIGAVARRNLRAVGGPAAGSPSERLWRALATAVPNGNFHSIITALRFCRDNDSINAARFMTCMAFALPHVGHPNNRLLHGATTVEMSPLMFAADRGFAGPVIAYLIAAGADRDAQLGPGHLTALHIACASGHYQTVRALVWEGCDTEREDARGWTCLSHARRKGHSQIVAWVKWHAGLLLLMARRRLCLALTWHPRLGKKSPAACLPCRSDGGCDIADAGTTPIFKRRGSKTLSKHHPDQKPSGGAGSYGFTPIIAWLPTTPEAACLHLGSAFAQPVLPRQIVVSEPDRDERPCTSVFAQNAGATPPRLLHAQHLRLLQAMNDAP